MESEPIPTETMSYLISAEETRSLTPESAQHFEIANYFGEARQRCCNAACWLLP